MSDETVSSIPNRAQQQKAYRFWAPVYDRVYGFFLKRAQMELARRVGGAGRDILEIGVGTGLVLPLYPPASNVTGIDISADMLRKAKTKAAGGSLPHVKALHVMDACETTFPDASFDVISLPFVITLIPDTGRLLSECARVLKPRGEIVIVSKITDSSGAVRRIEQMVSPVAHNIGLSSAFRLDGIEDWLRRNPSFHLAENRTIPPTGYFRLLRLSRSSTETSEKTASLSGH
ncbi:class I SAM-dependent methyltransferase [Agrobacterium sp. CMT1]|uniref:class I SAM-dependent methyltransferase n=1 Tax=Agrobacterium sp. CMT1 TaxID=3128901 RepID=UPI003077F9AC